jgi:alpha-methylacyl-CoA racemase
VVLTTDRNGIHASGNLHSEGAVGPLDGLKVIEIAAMGPVPFCGMLLGDMGADVLRVDRLGPSDLDGTFSPRFDFRGRNKRSVAIDLKHPLGRVSFLTLAAQADVVIEGFRPGVVESLGIGPAECLARRPSLVYGRATGWGQEGPLAQAAGHDINYVALAGALDMIGPVGGAPVPPLNLVGDYGGGALYLAFGIACAVIESRRSGQGQVVDAAMVDGVTSLLTVFHAFRQMGTLVPARGSNGLDGGAPYYTTYATRDGRYMAVGAIEPRFYANLLAGLDLDPAILPPQNRREAWPELRRQFAMRFATRRRDDWEVHFADRDACVTPVLTLGESVQHPHTRARDSLVKVDGVEHPAAFPRLSRTPGRIARRPAHRGEHTVEALRDWGFSADEIEAALRAGVLEESRS